MTKNYPLPFHRLIISIPALAQPPKPAAVSLPPADTGYFNRNWKRTEPPE